MRGSRENFHEFFTGWKCWWPTQQKAPSTLSSELPYTTSIPLGTWGTILHRAKGRKMSTLRPHWFPVSSQLYFTHVQSQKISLPGQSTGVKLTINVSIKLFIFSIIKVSNSENSSSNVFSRVRSTLGSRAMGLTCLACTKPEVQSSAIHTCTEGVGTELVRSQRKNFNRF